VRLGKQLTHYVECDKHSKEPFGGGLAVVGGHVVWSAVMIDPSDGIQIV